MDYPALRRERLVCLLADESLDALLITNAVNVTYLTGFSGDSSVLVLGRERAVLVSDPRFTQQIAEECAGLETNIRTPAQTIRDAVTHVLTTLGFRNVGFEHSLSFGEVESLQKETPTINWQGGADRVEKLRMVKDDWEL